MSSSASCGAISSATRGCHEVLVSLSLWNQDNKITVFYLRNQSSVCKESASVQRHNSAVYPTKSLHTPGTPFGYILTRRTGGGVRSEDHVRVGCEAQRVFSASKVQ